MVCALQKISFLSCLCDCAFTWLKRYDGGTSGAITALFGQCVLVFGRAHVQRTLGKLQPMLVRPHHQRIAHALAALDGAVLA